jgi:ABC-type transporter Mla subunit MlaD
MDNQSGHFRLGLFILVGIALIAGGIMFFSSGSLTEDSFIIETVTLESAQGLDPGAPVKFRGVRIGHVRKIELAYVRYRNEIKGAEQELGNAVILELGIRTDGLPADDKRDEHGALRIAVEKGLRARIASSSITGPPYVELVFLNPKTSPPLVLPWKPEKPYLPAGKGSVAQFVDAAIDIIESVREADVGKIINHADELILKADKFIDDIQMAEIRTQALALVNELRESNKKLQDILTDPNIKAMLADLAGTASSLRQTAESQDIKKFIADLPEISARLKKTMEQIDALLADENIKQALANLNGASKGANDAMADIKRLAKGANALLLSQQQDIAAIIRNFRTVAENANAITEDAKANPSRFLFGEPPPQAGRPKGAKR